ncbi:l diaminobutyrate decarboxylase [Fusarium pseudoanthophilum]|uniref:L diaminobutyrate decarboxylase n=1 Tax=Fusarium pseudoanthophilum TaxID=48495 RepID=A0A8H5P7Z5_9HYPO|nr:l diaminobutyrate decarboxylase [Fusarium pseudoanthophilum]
MPKVSPWKQRSDGLWSRPLIGPERMFDQWLEIDGWTEWMGAVIFTIAPSYASQMDSKAHVEAWFSKAVSRVCLEKPSLLAVIERGQEESAVAKSRDFVYRPLTSDDDFSERIKQRTTVLHSEKSAQEGLKLLTDDFYSTPEKRISLELGDHLIHVSLVSSSSDPGTFALGIRYNHALNDFWSGAAILNNLLSKLADGLSTTKVLSLSYKDAYHSSLHPCYLDFLRHPIGYTPLDVESREKAAQLLGANLANITLCPISQEPANDRPDTDYSVRRQVLSQETTQKLFKLCKEHGITVTALLTALQALALLKTFPPEDVTRTTAAPICVSNRLRQTSFGGSQGHSASTKTSLSEICQEAAYIGPVMATTFLVSPFDVSPYLKNKDASIGNETWRKIVWEVARNVGQATDEAVNSNLSEHVDWTQGPAAFGGVAHAMEAMKAGLLPSPALNIDDFSFYSRVSNLFGPQTWAWTFSGKLNIILVMPDPRVRSVPNIEWWNLFNEMVVRMATEGSSDISAYCTTRHDPHSSTMNTFDPPDQGAELDSLSSTFQAAFDRIFQTTQKVSEDPLLRVAKETNVSQLKDLSTPGVAHSVEAAIEDVFTISDFRMRMNHPKAFCFIPAPVSPLSWIGDCLSSAFNSFAGSRLQGSGVAVVEQTLLQWLSAKVGLPETSGGIFVSGGSMANMSGMVLARDCILEPDTEHLGVAYLSDQTHHSVKKALRIIGIRRSQIRVVPTNGCFQIDVNALKDAIKADRDAGLKPFVIIATCGTTNTGSIDPLEALAQVRDEENIWLHIDGAYGASASLAATRSSVTNGLGLADSISWDAHKWLFQTYSCSLILVGNRINLAKVFVNDGDYLRDALDDEEMPNFWNLGMELTRPSRALKLWFTLRVLGVERFGKMIDHGFHLAEIAAAEILKLSDWELTSRASMAIVTFRYAPAEKTEAELDELNTAISKHLVENNIGLILTTKLRGRVVLRICSISPVLSGGEMAEVIQQADKVAQLISKQRSQ